ncbi:ImmA/IrrE family metallo-endopeptidase [Luteibacter pinisoli]|uniref:ImmA/IrrE family metallo-endopeptidase n=1 Tax=Luteibacter pinisoli TaxID=2589080 RepID=A0A4Y5Z632_9GAMM|nr:ImmA/IrrE family metallo-endopeptidase [Luteibacter pinisoli]QDE39803.1 ImmA/IrrE family metallo-endopeptidase [Luteibacter pinisoli]
MDENTAIVRARDFLKRHGVTDIPIDVMTLAAAEGFQVLHKDLPDGESGSTVERRGQRYIWINANEPTQRQRFTVLHEIAHHVLKLPSVHGQAPSADDAQLLSSRRRPVEEVACDAFASECLVPYSVLKPCIDDRAFTVTAVQDLSVRFDASQHCVASQWIKASEDALAFVVANDRRIQVAFPSRTAKEAGLRIANGRMLPTGSAADQLVRASATDGPSSELDASEWSLADAAAHYMAYEEATNYVPKQRTYSFVTFEAVGNAPRVAVHAARDDDDDLLAPLTGELSWKPKR